MAWDRCAKCGQMHYATDPCRPIKSTAARKDVLPVRKGGPLRQTKANTVSSESPAQVSEIGTSNGKNRGTAGTQAPPVELIVGKRKGRPQTITDMKAYKAEKARIYRARKNA